MIVLSALEVIQIGGGDSDCKIVRFHDLDRDSDNINYDCFPEHSSRVRIRS